MCVCSFLNFVGLVFFYSGNSFTYFKVLCRSLQKKSDRKRCLAVSILEYNIKLEFEVDRAFGFRKEERNSVVIHR